MVDAILGFQGKHRFLSNFYPCPIAFYDRAYLSSESVYQAQKCPERAEEFTGLDAREARRLGQLVQARVDWEQEKLNIMYRILRVKFSYVALRHKLIGTGDAYLEETNYWHDTFWGIYNGAGENHLGRLLMIVRDEVNEGII